MKGQEKTYIVKRIAEKDGSKITCTVITRTSKYQLAEANQVSPCGFEIGYGGGGPNGLAFEILTDFLWGISSDSLTNDQFKKTWVLSSKFLGKFIIPMRLSLGESTAITGSNISRWLLEMRDTPTKVP